MDPNVPRQFPSSRHRQPHTRSGASFFQTHSSRSNSMASITHSLMGGDSPFSEEILAALMADFDRAATAGGTVSGSGQQDLSYEALTNLEDVKLTAPSELLATMPLDMCLKGGQWEDKVQSATAISVKAMYHTQSLFCHRCTQVEARFVMCRHICVVLSVYLHPACLQCFDIKLVHAKTRGSSTFYRVMLLCM